MPRSVKFLLVLIVLLVFLPFLIRDKHGRPLMKLNYFSAPKVALPDLSGVKRQGRKLATAIENQFEPTRETPEPAVPLTVYKWRGEDGTWVFSDHPNPSGESIVVQVDPRSDGKSPAAQDAPDEDGPAKDP